MMFLKRLYIVIILTFLAACITGMLLDRAYKKRWSVLFFEKTEKLLHDTTRFDIIFLGNSRVHFGINPYYVDSVTGKNSYNFGTGGADATDILLTTRLFLQKHRAPETAVLSLDMGALAFNETLKTRFQYLYYLDNDTLNNYMQKTGFKTNLVKSVPFTKYAFFDEYNRTSLFVQGKPLPQFDHNIYKGFLNIHQHTNSKASGIYDSRVAGDSLWQPAVSYFRNTIKAFRDKGTTVILVSPPESKDSQRRNTGLRNITDSIFSVIATEYQLKWLHFENEARYTDDYFVDDIHLNEPGTRIYSKQLADSIRAFLQ